MLALAEPAHAVYDPGRLPDPTRRWSVNLALRTQYDDNVNTTPTDKVGSFVSIINPGFIVNLPGEQTFMGLRYNYNAAYYWNRPGGNQLDESHVGNFSFSHTFSPRLTLSINDNVVYGIEPALVQQLPGPGAGTTITRLQGDYVFNGTTAELTYYLTRRIYVTTDGRFDYWHYDNEEVSTNNNRIAFGGRATANYAIDTRTVVGLSFVYLQTDYEFPGSNDVRNSDSQIVSGILSRRVNPRLSMRLNGGYQVQNLGAGGQQTSPVADLSATYNYKPDSSLTMGYRYILSSSVNVGQFQRSEVNVGYLSGSHAITRKLRLSTDFTYTYISYVSPIPGIPQSASAYEQGIRLNVGLTYDFTPWCQGLLSYSYEDVESDIESLVFDRNRASIGVRLIY